MEAPNRITPVDGVHRGGEHLIEAADIGQRQSSGVRSRTRLPRSPWNFGDGGPGVDRYTVTAIAVSWLVAVLGW